MSLTAIALNCTLKRSGGETSSTDKMIDLLAGEMRKQGVELTETIRVADHNVLPGVKSDEGPGDDWPRLRERILAADVLIFGTPIWLGQPSSIAKRVLERMDAFLSETDDRGRTPAFGKVAIAAVVGNEDGAHHSSAEIFQALNDVGWTIPPQAACYWVGEAMQSTDFKELKDVPEPVQSTARMVASTTAHLARLLNEQAYPGTGGEQSGNQ